jgi:hypothetical protein
VFGVFVDWSAKGMVYIAVALKLTRVLMYDRVVADASPLTGKACILFSILDQFVPKILGTVIATATWEETTKITFVAAMSFLLYPLSHSRGLHPDPTILT